MLEVCPALSDGGGGLRMVWRCYASGEKVGAGVVMAQSSHRRNIVHRRSWRRRLLRGSSGVEEVLRAHEEREERRGDQMVAP